MNGPGLHRRHKPLWYIALAVVLVAAGVGDARADQAARDRPSAAEIRRLFDPPVVRLPDERRVVARARLDAIAQTPDQHAALRALLDRHRVVVLSADRPGLALHFFAQGIDTMTPGDRVWENLPRRADSLQDLVDHAITRARAERRPIRKLTITGHAGLPGTCALGGTLDDCAFAGKLSDYHRRQLRRLRPYLAPDAEIELRQCTTGQGREGLALLTAIHQTTGAAVSSYLGDFRFGQSGKHPRLRVDDNGARIVQPD